MDGLEPKLWTLWIGLKIPHSHARHLPGQGRGRGLGLGAGCGSDYYIFFIENLFVYFNKYFFINCSFVPKQSHIFELVPNSCILSV